jgi:enamine deaminase RidA (YjgF/YER057c/UK114 family)
MPTIERRLVELGVALPTPSVPAASYVPWRKVGNLVFIAGQIPVKDGQRLFIGKVGREYTVEQGQEAARLVALNVLAHVKAACEGDLDRVVSIVRLGVFVNCGPEFAQHPMVANGASDLLVQIFGDAGRHTRAAVGAPSLPFDVAVEIDAVFEVA